MIIIVLYLLLLRKKNEEKNMENDYYILLLYSEYKDIKINLMLTKLTEQITLFQTNNMLKNIKILVHI